MKADVLFSSRSDEWTTPDDMFQKLNEEFDFNLDPCATDRNHKCDTYFTPEVDGLKQNWGGVQGVLQSPIQQDSGLGKESIYGIPETGDHSGNADTCEN